MSFEDEHIFHAQNLNFLSYHISCSTHNDESGIMNLFLYVRAMKKNKKKLLNAHSWGHSPALKWTFFCKVESVAQGHVLSHLDKTTLEMHESLASHLHIYLLQAPFLNKWWTLITWLDKAPYRSTEFLLMSIFIWLHNVNDVERFLRYGMLYKLEFITGLIIF